MQSRIALQITPGFNEPLEEEFSWIRAALPGNAHWAALHDGDSSLDCAIAGDGTQKMLFKLLDGTIYTSTMPGISQDGDEGSSTQWRYDLRRAALRIRSLFSVRALCQMSDTAILILRTDSAVLVRGGLTRPSPLPHYFVPAPDCTGHDMLEAEGALERDFPGLFRIDLGCRR